MLVRIKLYPPLDLWGLFWGFIHLNRNHGNLFFVGISYEIHFRCIFFLWELKLFNVQTTELLTLEGIQMFTFGWLYVTKLRHCRRHWNKLIKGRVCDSLKAHQYKQQRKSWLQHARSLYWQVRCLSVVNGSGKGKEDQEGNKMSRWMLV